MKNSINSNKAYLLTLVCESIKTVEVVFNFGTPDTVKTYTYLTILDLVEEQDVIVETPQGLKLAQVCNVHEEPEIEPNDPLEYKWVVGTDSTKAREEQERLQALALQTLQQLSRANRKANRRKVREELKEHFGETLGKVEDLFALTEEK